MMQPEPESNESTNRAHLRISHGEYQERTLALGLGIVAIVLAIFALTQMNMTIRLTLLSISVVAGFLFFALAKYIVYSAKRERIERDKHSDHGPKPIK